ncbi:MAG TPA: hypothetical protein EYG97_02595 [Arcobacter sp.]|nr:hypothetical protein [Arcobacter sp.]
MKITKLSNIYMLKKSNEDNFVLLANYLFIAYAFLLPINSNAVRFIFSIIIILFLLSGNIKEKLFFSLKNKVVISFILFYLLYVFWIIGSTNIDVAISQLKNYRYILYIVIYVAIIRKDFIYKILTGFLLGIFFSEIISYLMLFDIKVPYLVYRGIGANVPFMPSYTQYSTVLSISMGILLYGIIMTKQSLWLKLLSVVFFISASSNIFIIQSKLGYALYSVSILTVVTLIIFKYKKYWLLPLSIILIFTGYYIAYNTSDIFNKRVNGFFNESKSAVESKNYHTATGARVGFNVYGYQIIKENFLYGVGTSDHTLEFFEYVKVHEKNQDNINTFSKLLREGDGGSLHSDFLDTTMQFGIIGLLVFLNIFYQLFKYPTEEYSMKVVQIIFIVILLFVSSVSLIFLHSSIGKIFTLLSALSLKLYYSEDKIRVNKL